LARDNECSHADADHLAARALEDFKAKHAPAAPEARKVTTRKSRKVHETETTIDEEDLPDEPDDGDPAPGRDRDDEEDEEKPLDARAAAEDRDRAIGDAARYLASYSGGKLTLEQARAKLAADVGGAPKPRSIAPPPSRRMTVEELALLAQARAFCGIRGAS
jgi:hypothetical protein